MKHWSRNFGGWVAVVGYTVFVVINYLESPKCCMAGSDGPALQISPPSSINYSHHDYVFNLQWSLILESPAGRYFPWAECLIQVLQLMNWWSWSLLESSWKNQIYVHLKCMQLSVVLSIISICFHCIKLYTGCTLLGNVTKWSSNICWTKLTTYWLLGKNIMHIRDCR